jgi:hypothetical protein
MSAFTLRNLIRASGFAGVSGQSFRNHVTGAGSGAAMSQYKITAWSFTGTSNLPSTSPLGGSYEDGHVFSNIDIVFTQGSRAFNIKRTGAAMTVAGSGPYGFSVTASQSIVGGATGSLVTFTCRSPFSSEQVITGNAWYNGYNRPNLPPSGSGSVQVDFTANTTSSTASGVQNCQILCTYVPDIGDFNPTLTQNYVNIPFANRIEQVGDFNYEWRTTSSRSTGSVVGTSPTLSIQSAPGYSVSYWLFYQRKLSGSAWLGAGSVDWTDSRLN